jgi:hypothetical protein
MTPRGVRWLAQEGRLRYQATRSGQRLFLEADVMQLYVARGRDRLVGRAARLAAVHPAMLKAELEPQQQALFGFRKRK